MPFRRHETRTPRLYAVVIAQEFDDVGPVDKALKTARERLADLRLELAPQRFDDLADDAPRQMQHVAVQMAAQREQGAQVGGAQRHRLGTATARGRQQLIPERVQPTEAGEPLNRSGRAERAGQGHQHRPHRAYRRTVRTQVRHRSLPLRSRTLHVSTGIASPAIERTGAPQGRDEPAQVLLDTLMVGNLAA